MEDKLLFATWGSLKADSGVGAAGFVRALIEKDRTIENGAHVEQIKATYARRGLKV